MRAAFGPMAKNAATLDNITQKELWVLLIKGSQRSTTKFDV